MAGSVGRPGGEPVAALVGPLLRQEKVTAAWQALTAQLGGSIVGAAGVGISLIAYWPGAS